MAISAMLMVLAAVQLPQVAQKPPTTGEHLEAVYVSMLSSVSLMTHRMYAAMPSDIGATTVMEHHLSRPVTITSATNGLSSGTRTIVRASQVLTIPVSISHTSDMQMFC